MSELTESVTTEALEEHAGVATEKSRLCKGEAENTDICLMGTIYSETKTFLRGSTGHRSEPPIDINGNGTTN